jgi:hypothetical protein
VTFTAADGFPIGRGVPDLAANQVAYAWDLGAFTEPLHGRVLLGNISFTVPGTAKTGQSYWVRFGNADGAPDENTQYDFETFAARVWVNGPAAAAPDRISDEWKVKFFGSIDSPNAAPNADPDDDGAPNWKEYLAGTNPTDASSHLNLRAPEARVKNGKKQLALRWLSAPGKKYILESTSDLANGPWIVIASGVVGDGTIKEYLDSNTAAGTLYYRVRLQD